MSDDTLDDLNKAQRLALAAAEAPILRNATEKTLSRRIGLIDKAGNEVGHVSGRDVLKALAAVDGLESAVDPDARPRRVTCGVCGKRLRVPAFGPIPVTCRNECPNICGTPGCHSEIAQDSIDRARKRGRPRPVCGVCAARRRQASMTESDVRAHGEKIRAAITPEMRAGAARTLAAVNAKMSPERRAERAARSAATRRARREASREPAE